MSFFCHFHSKHIDVEVIFTNVIFILRWCKKWHESDNLSNDIIMASKYLPSSFLSLKLFTNSLCFFIQDLLATLRFFLPQVPYNWSIYSLLNPSFGEFMDSKCNTCLYCKGTEDNFNKQWMLMKLSITSQPKEIERMSQLEETTFHWKLRLRISNRHCSEE